MLRKTNVLTGAALLAGMLAVPALAEVPVTYVKDGRALFSVDVPDFWNMRSGGDRSLTEPGTEDTRPISRVIGLEPDERDGVWMGLVVPQGVHTLDEARDYLRYVGPSLLRDPVAASVRATRIGGREAAVMTGTGRRGTTKVSFTAAVIDLPGRDVAVAVAIVGPGASAGRVAQLNGVFDSFRVAR